MQVMAQIQEFDVQFDFLVKDSRQSTCMRGVSGKVRHFPES